MAGEIANGITKPFRIGIFWETESDAFPPGKGKEILNNLVSGLLDLEEPLEVILFIPPKDQDAVATLKYHSCRRLRSVSFLNDSVKPRAGKTILRKVGRLMTATGPTKEIAAKWIRRARSRISTDIRRLLVGARAKSRKSLAAGLPLLFLGGCLAAGIILVYWCLYSVHQLGLAALRSLFFPANFFLKIDAFQRWLERGKLSLDPLILAKQTECDVWLVPSWTFPHSLQSLKAATVLVIPAHLDSQNSQRLAARETQSMHGIASARIAEASLCVRPSLGIASRHPESGSQLDPAKIRAMPLARTADNLASRGVWHATDRKEMAQEWLKIFREAVQIAKWRETFDRKLMEPWPPLASAPATPRDPLKVFIFLPQVYYGGVLQVTRELVSELAAINAERHRLHLTLGLLQSQGSTQFVERLQGVSVRRMRLNPIDRGEVVRMCGGQPAWLADRPEQEFCFMSGAAQAAFDADAWFSLIDRFPLPLLPIRPLCILVQDVLQMRVPEIFDTVFFRSMAAGVIPTARTADAIVTGTTQTKDDVIAAYGIDPSRVRLIPVACNPHWHFSLTQPRPVAKVREPFILNVTNYSPHKGAEVLLRGYGKLKSRLGSGTPQLVMCGFETHVFSPSFRSDDDLPYWRAMRQLIQDLDIQEGRDIVFLGEVSDEQLHFLYQHCCVVVNAARYDNGCLCLAEGAYFGRPAVSSRYPAAEFHAQRFGYPGHFFPIGDAEAMAESLAAAIQEPPATIEDLHRIRSRFFDPEFSFRRYGERFYDLLIQLAEKGRAQKSSDLLRISA